MKETWYLVLNLTSQDDLLSSLIKSFVTRRLSQKDLEKKVEKVRNYLSLGKSFHPMTRGKKERYHRSMKNILP